jgi:hypothetical protein
VDDEQISAIVNELGGATISGDWFMRFGRAVAEQAVKQEREAIAVLVEQKKGWLIADLAAAIRARSQGGQHG